MSGYYPPPGHNIPPQYYSLDSNAIPNSNIQHAPPTIISHGSYAPTLPDNPFQPGVTGPFVQYENIGQPSYADQYEDMSGPMGSAHGGNGRARRRPAPGEQVKHRRTRSGCFTCRQRRVKVCASTFRCQAWLIGNSATKIIPSANVSTCACLTNPKFIKSDEVC